MSIPLKAPINIFQISHAHAESFGDVINAISSDANDSIDSVCRSSSFTTRSLTSTLSRKYKSEKEIFISNVLSSTLSKRNVLDNDSINKSLSMIVRNSAIDLCAETSKQTPIQFIGLVFSSVGVIYGDIGTSPLYAYSTIYSNFSTPVSEDDILGGLSLVIWTITFVVVIKYILIVMRATNHGEGGVFAAAGLLRQTREDKQSLLGHAALAFAIVSSALLVADGVITPALSVLSAVEGIQTVVTFGSYNPELPIALVILSLLFLAQPFGSQKMGKFFAPVVLLWFFAIGIVGAYNISQAPGALKAWNPGYIVSWFQRNGTDGWEDLGSVVLSVTGAEALYADVGYFGKNAVFVSFLVLVYPFIILSYIGQAAYVLNNPSNMSTSFYGSVPSVFIWPMVVLATGATIAASQAILSASFSLASQAIAVGALPRLKIVHVSDDLLGQVYVPSVNWTMAVLTLGVCGGFQTSAALTNSYSVAVSTIMILTTLIIMAIAIKIWKWHVAIVIPLFLCILFVDVNLWASTLRKIPTGGWLPLLIGIVLSAAMLIYNYGEYKLLIASSTINTDVILRCIQTSNVRYPSIGVYLCNNSIIPRSLEFMNSLKMPYPSAIVLLSIVMEEGCPYIHPNHRFKLTVLNSRYGFYHLRIRHGFADQLDSLGALVAAYLIDISDDLLQQSVSTLCSENHSLPAVLPSLQSLDTISFFSEEHLIIPKLSDNFLKKILINMYAGIKSTSTNQFLLFGLPDKNLLQFSTIVEL